MASVASQLIEEVTAHVQSDSLEGARKIYADGTYFPNNLRMLWTAFTCYMRNLHPNNPIWQFGLIVGPWTVPTQINE